MHFLSLSIYCSIDFSFAVLEKSIFYLVVIRFMYFKIFLMNSLKSRKIKKIISITQRVASQCCFQFIYHIKYGLHLDISVLACSYTLLRLTAVALRCPLAPLSVDPLLFPKNLFSAVMCFTCISPVFQYLTSIL